LPTDSGGCAITDNCPNPIGYFENKATGQQVPARCKSPTCPHCGPIYKKRLLDDVHYGAGVIQANGHRWRMLTLTTSPRSDQGAMSKYFNRFRSILRKHGYTPEFFKVVEFTEKGLRHFHIMISVFVPWNFIQYAWYMATEKTAYYVKITKAQIRSAAGYMAKYMTKDSLLSKSFKKHERRYSFSRHFPRLPKVEAKEEWSFIYKPNNNNLLREMQERLTIVKRQREEARRKTLELFPDIYKSWRSAYEWRALDM
jgi:hypothetical protein